MAGQGGYTLGVDLGTSNTVAVLRWPDGRTRPLLFDGQPIMPSGVFLDSTGRLHVGRDAQRLAQAEPARYEPNPKRRIDEPGVLLGDREVPIVDLLAAVLRAVAQAAVEAVGFLPPAVITYPASWGAHRREVLAIAVARAGWPPVDPSAVQTGVVPLSGAAAGTRMVPEPVAAARYFAEVLRRPVPVGSAIVVFDFGGGTLDIAVVRNDGIDQAGRAHFAVIGSGGVAELGGLDLDAALVDHLGQLLGSTAASAWHQLAQPTTVTGWRNRRQFWSDVRGAKEMLSRTAAAPVPVPGVEQAVHLTRDELERQVGSLLRRGVVETAAVISDCRLTPDQLSGLFLVGGSSRVPLVARLLHAELGIAPTVLEQPELPVAEGALADLAAPPVSAAGAQVSPAPTAGAAPAGTAPLPAAATAAAPGGRPPTVMTGTAGTAPGAPPLPGADVPAGALPVSPAPYAGPPGSLPGQRGPAGVAPHPVPTVAPGRRKRGALIIGVGAVVAVTAVVAAAVLVFTGRGYADLEFQPFTDVGRIRAGEEAPRNVFTGIVDDRAYLAYQRDDKRLEVVAIEAGTAKKRWEKQTAATSSQWRRLIALPDALVAFGDAAASSQQMVVLDPDNGAQRWSETFPDKDQVYFFDDVLVQVDTAGNRLLGRGLRDGKQRWSLPNLADANGNSASAIYSAVTAGDMGGPARVGGTMLVPHLADRRIVEIGADRSVRVIDAASGEVLKRRTNVADPNDLAMVYEGKLYVAGAERGYRLVAYDLKSMGEPTNLYTAPDDKLRARVLRPCGKERVCLLEASGFDGKTTQLVAVDAVKGSAIWRKPAPNAEIIVPVGEHVLVRSEYGEHISTIFRPDGSQLLRQEGVAVRLDGGNLLLFEERLSTYEANPSVVGIGVKSEKPVQLGALKGVRPATCSWSTTLIVCAAESDFVIRRFAAD